ncbi:FimV/HubP family polar landmark protein [Candidatus Parabeggiatoa sp. HSG14]|uniref:FimV/HubP family polar landmark protein n=1 Tax=Candidatus Parabeggiatoa sp. HSG14 TaxID=3055593 RepID=UPI0025A8C9F9|nr:FimV/HubP family polar landmark protein [Thiotrichales bacterium HSG14]
MKKVFLLLTFILINLSTVASMATTTYGPIKTGEMLWNIAASVRPDSSISRYQVMLALLKTNPHAFEITCNMNSLKVGETLRIPSPTDMKVLTRTQALKEFNRQQKEWKTYSRQRQQIVCPPIKNPLKKILAPVVETKASTPTTNSWLPPTENANNEVQKTIHEQMPPQSNEQIEPSFSLTSYTWDKLPSWFFTSSFLLIVLGIFMLFLLWLAFFLGRRLPKETITQSAVQRKQSNDSLENALLTSPITNEFTENKFNQKAFFSASKKESISEQAPSTPENPSIAISQPTQKSNSNEMKEKLDYVRAYLAGDVVQRVERLLREVIQKGSPEQQEEAKQLYEINKKMNYLKQNMGNNEQIVIPPTKDKPKRQELMQTSKHLSTQQYLPEEREKMLGLVDKIFEVLDYELNAQGKLVEAHTNRHKQEFVDTNNYEIVEKQEKWVVEDEEEDNLKSRSELKSTRHL